MVWGQTVLVYSRLILAAAAAFLAIMSWQKNHDPAWLMVIMGTVSAYAETVCSVLENFGIILNSILTTVLPPVRMVFFIAAFLIMVVRQYRHQ